MILPNILNNNFLKFENDDWKTTKIISGESYIILRKEIRQLAVNLPPKDIDIFIYLHDKTRCSALENLSQLSIFSTKIISEFEPDFVTYLARAKIFISGFGISFNEALALKTIPVCWPDSDIHRQDALKFYRNLNMTPLLIESSLDMENIVLPLLKEDQQSELKRFEDGTPNIVAELATLF